MAVGRVVNVEEMVETAVERVRKLWSEGRVAVVEAATGNVRNEVVVTDGGEHDEWSPTEPALTFRNCISTSWHYIEMEYLTLRLPPPERAERGATELRRLLMDFFAPRGEEERYGFHDGAAAFGALVDFCSEVYGQHSARGLRAAVYDSGGDYPSIRVELTWLG
jgi:hypothetical protein